MKIESSLSYLDSIKNKYLSILNYLKDRKLKFYIIYFILFYFLYFNLTAKYTYNLYEKSFNKNTKNVWYLITIYGGLFIYLITLCYYFYKNNYILQNKENKDYQFISFILMGFTFIFIYLFFYFMQVFFKYITIYLSDFVLKILLGLFYVMNGLFLLFYIGLYTLNLNAYYNVEVLISILFLIIFYSFTSINISYNKDKIFKMLKKNDYDFLTLNCLLSKNREKYQDTNDKSIQNKIIQDKYGIDYLELKDNIPVRYLNKKTKKYENLKLCDFYYPGSYYSYLGNSPLNGTPNLEALKLGLEKFKLRIIVLDIYSDLKDPNDPKSEPVVRCKFIKKGSTPLKLGDCFRIINEYAWIQNNGNSNSYPFICVLNFHFGNVQHLYLKIYNIYIEYFSKYLVDKKYGFSGRNSDLPISKAPMNECLGKIILITNTYPTYSLLDELINASSTTNSFDFQLLQYKKSYIDYEKIGISQDFNKNELVKMGKNNMRFFYTLPNEEYKNNEESKAGLYNPRFQDIAQYGLQGTLMYIFVPDSNLNDWYLFFKNKSNFDPVLKDELLRNTKIINKELKQPKQIVGLQKNQKYCLIPGLLDTEKGNISNSTENNSCKK
jgi:hypothetical protein